MTLRSKGLAALSAVLAVLAATFLWLASPAAIEWPAGVIVRQAPVQVEVQAAPFQLGAYTVTPRATFDLTARVLASRRYSGDREAQLAPIDIAFGWQHMSDSAVLARIDISQKNRFYFWWTDNFPVPRRAIETQSANMHLIPATAQIRAGLEALPVGALVRLRGYLVGVRAADGWRWDSSMTREDVGRGACELIYVTALQRLDQG